MTRVVGPGPKRWKCVVASGGAVPSAVLGRGPVDGPIGKVRRGPHQDVCRERIVVDAGKGIPCIVHPEKGWILAVHTYHWSWANSFVAVPEVQVKTVKDELIKSKYENERSYMIITIVMTSAAAKSTYSARRRRERG